ncbi:Uncharacterised protein [Klebsiella pneumoniae]|nr:Uncharacterised protein [Klebsiella pneumoniae]
MRWTTNFTSSTAAPVRVATSPTPAPSIMISPTVAINDPVDFASIVPISGRPVEVIIMAIIIEEMTASTISTPISDNIASATSGVNPSRPSSLPGRPWHHSAINTNSSNNRPIITFFRVIFCLTGALPVSVESLITLLNANQSDHDGQVVYGGLLRKYPPSFSLLIGRGLRVCLGTKETILRA